MASSNIKKEDKAMTMENEQMAAAIIENYECLSPNSKKNAKEDVEKQLERIYAPSSPSSPKYQKQKASTIDVSSDSEGENKIKPLKGISKTPKPSTSKLQVTKRSSIFGREDSEDKGKSKKKAKRQQDESDSDENVTKRSSIFGREDKKDKGKPKKKAKRHQEDDSDSDENEEYSKSPMRREILKKAKHGSCGDRTLTHLAPGVAVIAEKKGRAARCGNRMCREDLNVGDTVVVMLGSFSGNFKKVYFCPEISCCKKRYQLDHIEPPTKYVVACFIGKREKNRLKDEFSNRLEMQDCDNHM